MDTMPIRNLIGAGASWAIRNDVGPDNGLPTGGTASLYHSGTGHLLGSPGFGIAEASLGSQLNAFDGASLLFVNNQIFVAPTTVDIASTTTTGGYNIMTAGSVTLSGLNVTMQLYADQTLPVLRTFVSFTNPTATAITVPVTFATNVGSDANTAIQATSNGDTTFAVNDHWMITDDNPTNGALSDTHVLAGPGNPTVIANSVSQTVFDYVPNSGTEGVLANYTITIPANSTRNLLVFNGVNQTSADAKSTAAIYNDVSLLQGSTLLTGLTSQQLSNTLNWDSLVPQISVGNISLFEGNSSTKLATFNISLSTASGKSVTVDYATADASATAQQDYQPLAGTVTFNPGETVKTVAVAINGDLTVEPDETFSLNLSNAQNALIGTATGLGTILNDDQETLEPGPKQIQGPATEPATGSGTILNGDQGTLEPGPKQIQGSAKADNLSGSEGNDWLSGEAGNDNLIGGAGDDVLVGGAGGDTLTGGLGADRFEYSVTKGRIAASSVRKAPKSVHPSDHITDLNPNQGDRIELLEATLPKHPLSVSNAGQVQRGQTKVPSLTAIRRILPSLYSDKNSVKKGSQAVRPNEALFFQMGSRSYLSINDKRKDFSSTHDLVIDVTGMQFLPGDNKIGTLNWQNYFT